MASIIRQTTTKRDKNGQKIRIKSKRWYIDYKDGSGVRRRVRGFRDKVASAQLAAKLEREAEFTRAGLVDKYQQHRERPLSKHLDDFRDYLHNKGVTEQHYYLVFNRAKAVMDGCKFAFPNDLSASKVQEYLAARRQGGLGIRSSNFYLQAAKQFLRWMVSDGRLPDNPLGFLRGLNPKLDVRHKRRALTTEEAAKLINTTANGATHSDMTGLERAMLYKLALNTGFRACELYSLTWDSFDFSESAPAVCIKAAYSKHRRDDVLPLRKDLARELMEWQAERGDSGASKVFGTFDPKRGARILKKDLDVAGIPYRDKAGRVVDFHALRHSFSTLFHRSGATMKEAQTAMRHSTIGLTMDTYTHLEQYDVRNAMERMPILPKPFECINEADEVVAEKTGTDDSSFSGAKKVYKGFTNTNYPDRKRLSSHDTNEDGIGAKAKHKGKGGKSQKLSKFDNERAQLAGNGNRRGWDSNPRNACALNGFRDRCPKVVSQVLPNT